MQKLFDKNYIIIDYNRVTKDAEAYISAELSKNLSIVTKSLEEYKKYKENTVSLDDVPSYKIASYKYKYIHSINVSKKCVILAEKAGLSTEVMALAGLLHDVGHYSCNYKMHGVKSAELAMKFIERHCDMPQKDIEAFGRIISAHYPIAWDEAYYKSDIISKEEVVLLEADFWDKNDFASFLEKSKLTDLDEVNNKFEKIQNNCVVFLNEKVEDRDCEYTDGFYECIKVQMEQNKKSMDSYILSLNDK